MNKRIRIAGLMSLIVSVQVAQAQTRTYDLYRNTANDSTTATLIANISTTGHTDVPPNTDTDYYYWVRVRTEVTTEFVGFMNLYYDYHVRLTLPTSAVRGETSKVTVYVEQIDKLPGNDPFYVTLFEEDFGYCQVYKSWDNVYGAISESFLVDLGAKETGSGEAEVRLNVDQYPFFYAPVLGPGGITSDVINVPLSDAADPAPANLTASTMNTSGVVLTWSSATGNSDFSSVVIGRRISSQEPPPPPPGSETVTLTATVSAGLKVV